MKVSRPLLRLADTPAEIRRRLGPSREVEAEAGSQQPARHDAAALDALTQGMAEYGVDYQRRITFLGPPAIDLTLGSGPDDALAAVDASPGQGCVVLIADQSSFTDAGSGGDHDLGTPGNATLLGNIVDWFQGQACGVIAACDAGAVLAGPTEACEGELLSFDASASTIPACAGVVEHRWLRDGTEIAPWDAAGSYSEPATASATYRVEIRCDVEPACQDFAEMVVTVEPDVPPPSAPNLLLALEQGDGILFRWQDTGAFAHSLRRASAVPFDRAMSEAIVTLSGTFEHFEPGEQDRPPWLLFYQVFAANCAGTEEQ